MSPNLGQVLPSPHQNFLKVKTLPPWTYSFLLKYTVTDELWPGCVCPFRKNKARENSKGFQGENCYHLESNKDLLHDSLLHSLWEPEGNGVLCKALKESKFKSRILYQNCYVLNLIFPQKLFD